MSYICENHGVLKRSCYICGIEEENKTMREALEEISECVDSFYDEGVPRKLFPELKKFAGFIQVIDKVSKDALK